ncbi:MAG: hypothetical protein L6V95_14670 [Candidatus Melainabacteria bacterium]|nr:MAG: hypothetical protein L6V95_14670 [Candidatus Melainabacteria bacterium]
MIKGYKKKITSIALLSCLFLSNLTAFAGPNYVYTTVHQQNCVSSSPHRKTFVTYPSSQKTVYIDVSRHVPPRHYPPHNVRYIYAPPSHHHHQIYMVPDYFYSPQSGTNIYYEETQILPPNYSNQTITTHIYEDNREKADKVIDRTGKIVGIAGLAAIVGLGTAALIKAF